MGSSCSLTRIILVSSSSACTLVIGSASRGFWERRQQCQRSSDAHSSPEARAPYLVFAEVSIQSCIADGGRRPRGPVCPAHLPGELLQDLCARERGLFPRHRAGRPSGRPRGDTQVPPAPLTLSSKVKHTCDGYSLSAITTPASPSPRTWTWHR